MTLAPLNSSCKIPVAFLCCHQPISCSNPPLSIGFFPIGFMGADHSNPPFSLSLYFPYPLNQTSPTVYVGLRWFLCLYCSLMCIINLTTFFIDILGRQGASVSDISRFYYPSSKGILNFVKFPLCSIIPFTLDFC
jgi:hypothetical protein